MKKIAISLLLIALMVGVAYGAAAALTVNTSTLGAGSGSVTSCDTDGVDIQWYTHMTDNAGPRHDDGGVWVDKVKVKNIDATCNDKWAHMSIRALGGNHVQMCREQIASGAALMENVSPASTPPYQDCLNALTVWADEVSGVRVIIKDQADW